MRRKDGEKERRRRKPPKRKLKKLKQPKMLHLTTKILSMIRNK
jgi:hypothetical protein